MPCCSLQAYAPVPALFQQNMHERTLVILDFVQVLHNCKSLTVCGMPVSCTPSWLLLMPVKQGTLPVLWSHRMVCVKAA